MKLLVYPAGTALALLIFSAVACRGPVISTKPERDVEITVSRR